ncbi:HlyD family efflux transporter periplasmic adaptor subunit [Photorhabdus temperata]|uniref:HlyD family secretion protein n=1 Tax=Photorhabdus temperata TaxID=574560 RepID=UPI0021D4F2E4|nr:HlyD family efflux transporter periplasmic adaptor subunit [Photorhabdus temperata]MCT8349814.1 HlyD family efflux transporter periplasmic adaptor subunit [Photorhabdus temperata]
MNEKESIFREEALSYKENSWLGDFSISVPSILPVAVWISIGVLIIAIVILLTNYAQRVPAIGQVLYFPAAAESVFNQDGVISKIKVQQGDFVKKGDLIATVYHDIMYEGGGVNITLQENAEKQIKSLKKRKEEKGKERENERLRLIDRISIKKQELSAIKKALSSETKRSENLKKRLVFYQDLRNQGIAVESEKIERENDYHNSLSQIDILNINIERTIGEELQLVDELARSQTIEKEEIISIQQEIMRLEQQVINSSATVESRIIAPIEGTIASMKIFEGERVNTGGIAAVIVPNGAKPFIEILIPPNALPDVKVGQTVMMRVASLPWEWFGKVPGKITSISNSPDSLSGKNRRFRVVVLPDANGRELPTGVEVEADILTTRRPLWEWIFSPIKQNIIRVGSEG